VAACSEYDIARRMIEDRRHIDVAGLLGNRVGAALAN
jgi:hypothetical protein